MRRCEAFLSIADMVHAVIEAYIREEDEDDNAEDEGDESVLGDEGITGGPRGSAAARARFKNAAEGWPLCQRAAQSAERARRGWQPACQPG